MAGMRGEMSQMVAERPNAGAVRHYDRCGVISRPRGGGFVPFAAHRITPIDLLLGLRNVRTVLARALQTFACSWLVLLWLVCPRHPKWEAASRLVPRSLGTLLRPSTGHEQFRPSSAMRPSGAFRARRCHALARCCASLAFAWNRCASLRSSSSARQ